MSRASVQAAALALALLASPARADLVTPAAPAAAAPSPPAELPAPLAAEGPRNALSLPVMSIQSLSGVAAQYERHALPRWSLAGRAGARNAADGDYGALALSAGVHARYWLRRRAIWSAVRAPSMIGWHVSLGVDASWTRITAREGAGSRDLGAAISIAPAAAIGYRFAPWRGLEITPSLGLGTLTEVDTTGALAPWTRGTITTGVTVGWLY